MFTVIVRHVNSRSTVAAHNVRPEQQVVTKHTAGHSSVKVLPSVLAAIQQNGVSDGRGSEFDLS